MFKKINKTKTIEPGKDGACYENAYKYVIYNDCPECKIVHGEVTNYLGETFGHAWIINNDEVIDPTTGVITEKDKYYETLKAKDISIYSDLEAMKMSTKTKNSGPWTDEERKKILGKRKPDNVLGSYGGWISTTGKYNQVDYEGHASWMFEHKPRYNGPDIEENAISSGWIRFAFSENDLGFDIYSLSSCRIIDNFILDNNLLSFDEILISTTNPQKYYNVSKQEYEESDFNLKSAIQHSRDIRGIKKLSYDDYSDGYDTPYVEDSFYGEEDLRQDKTDLRSVIKDLLQDVSENIKDPDLKGQKTDDLKNLLVELNNADNEVTIQDIRDRVNIELDYIEQAGDQTFYTGYDFPDREPAGPISHPGGGLHLQDTSTEQLMRLVEGGYTHAIWNLHELHPEEDICDTLHGNVFRLEDLALGLEYNAPIFETSHVNCICWLLVYSEYDADLPWRIVDAVGPDGPVFA